MSMNLTKNYIHLHLNLKKYLSQGSHLLGAAEIPLDTKNYYHVMLYIVALYVVMLVVVGLLFFP